MDHQSDRVAAQSGETPAGHRQDVLLEKQLLQIQCAALTQAKQTQFLQSLQAVFQQFQVEVMQLEIRESI